MTIQLMKLREIVAHSYRNVPFYAKLYDDAGAKPDVIHDLGSLGRLPMITKELFRSVPLEERTTVGVDIGSCKRISSSGSTGTPITILDDAAASSIRTSEWLRQLWAYGLRPYHKLCRVAPRPISVQKVSEASSNPGDLLQLVKARRIKNLFLEDDVRTHIEFLSHWKPDFLVASSSYFRTLAKACLEGNCSLSLKVAHPTGELLDDATRRLIADSFRAEVYDGYGAIEVGGISFECPTHFGYHIQADNVIIEFLRDGEPAAPEEQGEICATNLFNRVTPVVRYLLGDVASTIEDECPCGRGLPLMTRVQGRIVDYVRTRDGHSISPLTITKALQAVKGVNEYKMIQRSDYSVELLVKTTTVETEQMIRDVQQRCSQLFGDIPVNIKYVDEIENHRGHKGRLVESHLDT